MTNERKHEIYARLDAIRDLINATVDELSTDDEIEAEIRDDLKEESLHDIDYWLNKFYLEFTEKDTGETTEVTQEMSGLYDYITNNLSFTRFTDSESRKLVVFSLRSMHSDEVYDKLVEQFSKSHPSYKTKWERIDDDNGRDYVKFTIIKEEEP